MSACYSPVVLAVASASRDKCEPDDELCSTFRDLIREGFSLASIADAAIGVTLDLKQRDAGISKDAEFEQFMKERVQPTMDRLFTRDRRV